MDYMGHMVESQREEADCVLIAESQELACHSQVLSPLSPVLAGLRDTRPRKDGKRAVPLRGTYQAAPKFLYFCYRENDELKVLSLEEAYELAQLSHEWDVEGLASLCNATLVRMASEEGLLKAPKCGSKMWSSEDARPASELDVVDWALLANRCNLPEFLSVCKRSICGNIIEVAKHAKFAELSGKSHVRIMWGVMATKGQGTRIDYCSACACPSKCQCERSCRQRPAKQTAFGFIEPPRLEQFSSWASAMSAQGTAADAI